MLLGRGSESWRGAHTPREGQRAGTQEGRGEKETEGRSYKRGTFTLGPILFIILELASFFNCSLQETIFIATCGCFYCVRENLESELNVLVYMNIIK